MYSKVFATPYLIYSKIFIVVFFALVLVECYHLWLYVLAVSQRLVDHDSLPECIIIVVRFSPVAAPLTVIQVLFPVLT